MDSGEPKKVDELDTYVLVERFEIGKALAGFVRTSWLTLRR